MANVKTAVSIDPDLFAQVNRLADALEVSRSHLFALAVEEFIERYENRQLLQQLNEAYDDLPSTEDDRLIATMRVGHRNLEEGEW